jgi:DNA-binding beta-propeller fold protein YncE
LKLLSPKANSRRPATVAIVPFERRHRICAAGFLLALGFAAVIFAAQGGPAPKENIQGFRAGKRLLLVGPDGSPFNMPSDAAVGHDGDLYVLDGVHHRVVVYDAEGKFRFQFGERGSGAGQLLFPLGIAASPDGKVYVADSGNHRFQVFTAEGKPLEIVPLPATPAIPPDPTDVAVDPTGKWLYIADNDNHHVLVYDLTKGSFESVWGGPGQGRRQFRYPFLIDTSSQGYVLVVEPINTRVQVLNSSGKFVGFIGGWGIKPGQLFRPKGVATYGDRVFVTDSYLGRVQVFDIGGDFLGMLTDANQKPIQLITPTGVTIDEKRRCLYVVELKANRVSRIDLE